MRFRRKSKQDAKVVQLDAGDEPLAAPFAGAVPLSDSEPGPETAQDAAAALVPNLPETDLASEDKSGEEPPVTRAAGDGSSAPREANVADVLAPVAPVATAGATAATASATSAAPDFDALEGVSALSAWRQKFLSRRLEDLIILVAAGAFFTFALTFAAVHSPPVGGRLMADGAGRLSPPSPEDLAWSAYQSGNFETARRIWKDQASRGNANAQYNLGLLYAEGRGVVRNPQAAMDWWRLAAERGHAGAQYNLGQTLLGGESLYPGEWSPNPDEGVKWLRRAANAGNASALRALGETLYAQSETRDEGLSRLSEAADKGDTEAAWRLGQIIYQDRPEGFGEREGLALLFKAAHAGHGQAQGLLSDYYRHGDDLKPDLVEALAWATLATGNGVFTANRDRVDLLARLSDEDVALANHRVQELIAED